MKKKINNGLCKMWYVNSPEKAKFHSVARKICRNNCSNWIKSTKECTLGKNNPKNKK